MRKSEIEIGKSYSNGKGRIRKVVAFGPEFKLYEGQECQENMQYEIVKDGTKANRTAGKKGVMTLASFASGVKEAVE